MGRGACAMVTRISKAEWERLGGFKNTDLFRREVDGKWQYYKGAAS